MKLDPSNQKRYKIPIEKLFYSLNGSEISLVQIATLAVSSILAKNNTHPIDDVKVEEPKAREYLLFKISELKIPIHLEKILFDNTIFLRICFLRVNKPFSSISNVMSHYKSLSKLIDEFFKNYRIHRKKVLRNSRILMYLKRNSGI